MNKTKYIDRSIKLIIVDFDGVLNNLKSAKVKTIKEAFSSSKLKISDLQINYFLNYIDQVYISQHIHNYNIISYQVLNLMVESNVIDLTDESVKHISKKFSASMKSSVSINHPILGFLEKVKNYLNCKMCVYSSQQEQYVTNSLKGRTKIFDRIYGLGSFEEYKPSINNVLKICKDFNVEPASCLMIGDNVDVDLSPAKYVGMKTMLFNSDVDLLFNKDRSLNDFVSFDEN